MDNALEQQRVMARMLGTQDDPRFAQFEQMFRSMGSQQSDSTTDEIFEYEGETLQRIVSQARSNIDGSESPVYTHMIYEAPIPGQTDATLYDAAFASLYDAVINSIRQFDPTKRAQTHYYNLILSYDAVADDGLLLTLGLQAQREAWERETDETSYRSLQYHSLMTNHNSINIWELLTPEYERFIRVNRREQTFETIRQLLNEVARKLNDFDWTGILNTTDDFIVFANDYEALEDPHDEIRACVPERKIRLLQERGLLE